MKNSGILDKLRTLLLVILFISVATKAIAGRDIPDDNLAYPVLVIIANGGTGSGFYLDYEDSTYFVTARHVLFDKTSVELSNLPQVQVPYELLYRIHYDKTKKNISFDGVMTSDEKDALIKSAPKSEPFKKAIEELYQKSQKLLLHANKVTLLSYSTKVSDAEVNEVEIELPKLVNGGYVKYHHSADVVIVKIGLTVKTAISIFDGVKVIKGPGIVSLPQNGVKLFNDVLVGNSIYCFGYPTSVSQNPLLNIKLPLLRKGIISGKNVLLKTIILDASVYYGNSGGLVIESEQVHGQSQFKGIGIVTNFVPFKLSDDDTVQNSGYSVAVPMDFILELIQGK